MARKTTNSMLINVGEEKCRVTYEISPPHQDWDITTLLQVARNGYMSAVRAIITNRLRQVYPMWVHAQSIIAAAKQTGLTDDMLRAFLGKMDFPFDPLQPLPSHFVITEEDLQREEEEEEEDEEKEV